MKYYIKETLPVGDRQKNARGKARADVEGILDQAGYQPIAISLPVYGPKMPGLKRHIDVSRRWKDALGVLKGGDILAIQFPIVKHSVFLMFLLKELRKRGVITILITHDLETLRLSKQKSVIIKKKLVQFAEETGAMKTAGAIIVHNERMKQQLCRFGITEKKMIPLGIFDYLIPGVSDEELFHKSEKTDPVIIAGNLDKKKCGYLYRLPDGMEWNLYGVGYEDQSEKNIHYFGSFLPEELPGTLWGSFGLVWDGENAETCTGVYGEYLKINNPHKTSLYLAAGHPVIVWSQSAMADFVRENQVGIAVDSLNEVKEAIDQVSGEEYEQMCRRAEKLSQKLRAGVYLKTALERACAAAEAGLRKEERWTV